MKDFCVFYFSQEDKGRVQDFDSDFAMRGFLQNNILNQKIPYIIFQKGKIKQRETFDKCTDEDLGRMMTDFLVEEQRKGKAKNGNR